LKRAYATAEAIFEKQPEPKPVFQSSPLLREQHFGIAEGKAWTYTMTPNLSLEEHFAQGLFPVTSGRDEAFPEGESLNDVARRAEQAIQDFIFPEVRKAAEKGMKGLNIAIVSHGICISELVSCLMAKGESGHNLGHKYRGMRNTAWSRISVNIEVDIFTFVSMTPIMLISNRDRQKAILWTWLTALCHLYRSCLPTLTGSSTWRV
jgi:broad specificity phosphatase PhoE